MATKTKISKTWKSAGSRPGQYQKLTLEFLSRAGSVVKVHYKLRIKSNGTDTYTYNQRHNKFTIYCPKGTKKKTGTYQARGTRASKSFSGTFKVRNVANTTDSLTFWYRNQRIWATHTDAYEPRSTGVVGKTKIGSIKIPKNEQYPITFDEIFEKEDNAHIHSYLCWYGKDFTIPAMNPTSEHYEFLGWTDVDYLKDWIPSEDEDEPDDENEPEDEEEEEDDDQDSDEEEQTNNDQSSSSEYDIPTEIFLKTQTVLGKIYSGAVIKKVTGKLSYFAVWKPKRCTCKFYDCDKKLLPSKYFHGDDTDDYYWNIDENGEFIKKKLPDLSNYSNGQCVPPGYEFVGWACNKKRFLKDEEGIIWCDAWSSSGELNFYPIIRPLKNEVRFITPDNILSYEYYTDDQFDMSRPLKDIGKTTISIFPGYKLAGWITFPPSKIPVSPKPENFPASGIANPGQAFNIGDLKEYSSSVNRSKYYNYEYIDFGERVDPRYVFHYYGEANCWLDYTSDYSIYPTSGQVTFKYNYTQFAPIYQPPTDGRLLKLYPYYEYYTTIYVYDNGEWKLAMPYIYNDGEWKMALSYVYDNGEWKL